MLSSLPRATWCTDRSGIMEQTHLPLGRRSSVGFLPWRHDRPCCLRPDPQARRAGRRRQALAPRAPGTRLRQDLVHLDATIRLFDPSYDIAAGGPKRPPSGASPFVLGGLTRAIFDALRTAQKPLTIAAITLEVMAAKESTPRIGNCWPTSSGGSQGWSARRQAAFFGAYRWTKVSLAGAWHLRLRKSRLQAACRCQYPHQFRLFGWCRASAVIRSYWSPLVSRRMSSRHAISPA